MENKTEKATPKKRSDERKKGNVFQSKELLTVGVLLIAVLILSSMLSTMGRTLTLFSIKYFSSASAIPVLGPEQVKTVFLDMLEVGIELVLPIVLVIMASIVLITFAQTRFLFSTENLKMKFSRLNPLNGIKRLFSLRSVMEVIKAVFKILLFLACFYFFISSQITMLAKIQSFSVAALISYIVSSSKSLIWMLLGVYGAICVFDYAYQWWEYEKNIRMSKQEIKQEFKEQEGDPQVKGRIKEIQRSMATGRMMQKVPEADVIIRNPTHYAVALKFDVERKIAPVVVAKGVDEIAYKIIEIALEHEIPMTENVELARALYRDVEVDSVIPREYYDAVAKVLAWVYNIKKKG